MARDMSDKEILKMELDQLKKEVSTARTPVSKNNLSSLNRISHFLAINCGKNLSNVTFDLLLPKA